MTFFIRVSAAILTAVAAFHGAGDATAGPPARFRYQARLIDSAGLPLAGSHTLTLGVWSGGTAGAANSGTKLYEETAAVTADAGVVSASVGAGAATFGSLDPSALRSAAGDLFVQVAVDGAANVVLPRTRIDSVPFALASAGDDPRTAIGGAGAALPLVIDKPGSYYLTGDIVGRPGANGLEITTGGVTLDLNGFNLSGPEGSLSAVVIASSTNVRLVEVRNGTITGWNAGLVLFQANQCAVADIKMHGVAFAGILCRDLSSVTRCSVHGDFAATRAGSITGIQVGQGSTVEDCNVSGFTTASGFGVVGINAGSVNCVVNRCVVSGLVCGAGGVMTGVAAGQGASVRNSRVATSTPVGAGEIVGIGIDDYGSVADSSVLALGQNVTSGKIRGIVTGVQCQVSRCRASALYSVANPTALSVAGIQVGFNSRVEGCLVKDVKGSGSANNSGGVMCVGGCVVSGNTIHAVSHDAPRLSSGAISITDIDGLNFNSDNVIVGNSLAGNDAAISVPSSGPNYWGRNYLRGNLVEVNRGLFSNLIDGTGAEANITF